MSFFLEFVRSPATVGAFAASGSALADVVTAVVPRVGSPLVVEVGPGTGAFTEAIQRRLPAGSRHIAVEANARFADRLAGLQPAVEVINADASTLGSLLAQRGIGPADVVVSGLPWAVFTRQQQQDILTELIVAMAPDGVFTTFAYVHARLLRPARRLLESLRSRFDEVVIGRTVWANLPPALVYYCRRPYSGLEPAGLPGSAGAGLPGSAQAGQETLGSPGEQVSAAVG